MVLQIEHSITMAYHYLLRNSKKKSLSETLDIGAGKYVHNVEFMSNSENTKYTSIDTFSGSVDDQKSSWEDIQTGKVGNYVRNVEYPTIVDFTPGPPQDQDSKVSSVQSTSDAFDPSSRNMTSSGHTKVQNADQIANVARASKSIVDDLKKKPNFSKLHAEYKEKWYKNHPANET